MKRMPFWLHQTIQLHSLEAKANIAEKLNLRIHFTLIYFEYSIAVTVQEIYHTTKDSGRNLTDDFKAVGET
jgi:hypothetical protein